MEGQVDQPLQGDRAGPAVPFHLQQSLKAACLIFFQHGEALGEEVEFIQVFDFPKIRFGNLLVVDLSRFNPAAGPIRNPGLLQRVVKLRPGRGQLQLGGRFISPWPIIADLYLEDFFTQG